MEEDKRFSCIDYFSVKPTLYDAYDCAVNIRQWHIIDNPLDEIGYTSSVHDYLYGSHFSTTRTKYNFHILEFTCSTISGFLSKKQIVHEILHQFSRLYHYYISISKPTHINWVLYDEFFEEVRSNIHFNQSKPFIPDDIASFTFNRHVYYFEPSEAVSVIAIDDF